MINGWDNAPWTARGLKFKHTVEAIVMIGGYLLVSAWAGKN